MSQAVEEALAAQWITDDELAQAREAVRQEGGALGDHLILEGAISPEQWADCLAHAWNTRVVDLVEEPPDAGLVDGAGLTPPQLQRWVPWRLVGSSLRVATCTAPDADLITEVNQHFPDAGITFVVVVPSSLQQWVQLHFRQEHLEVISDRLALTHPELSARSGLATWQKLLPLVLVIVAGVGFWINWWLTLVVVLWMVNVAFAGNVVFKIIASLIHPVARLRARRLAAAERDQLEDMGLDPDDLMARAADLPVYTILVPVYQESEVVGQIIANLANLRYPETKLDILVLLEESDPETIDAARRAHPPANMRLLVVPDGQPRTKPRACNYGLLFARGEYVVIYDAEDRPDPDELLHVLRIFRHDEEVRIAKGGRPLACVQASLNYYNTDYNVLTRMFGIEYAHWFDSMLPGVVATGMPIPLGGTSNHFRMDALLTAGGWDSYNVTEDADLGLRLAGRGYRTDVTRTTTWEEATARTGPWIRQRTRWIKGYMVTAAVNLRRPWHWLVTHDFREGVCMFGLILGTPLAFLAYPAMIGFTILAWLLGPVFPLHLPYWLWLFGMINMIVLNGLLVLLSGVAAWRRYSWRVGIFAVFLPVYWLGHSTAAWRAATQVFRSPSLWEKTPHGLTEEYDDEVLETFGLKHSPATAADAGRPIG